MRRTIAYKGSCRIGQILGRPRLLIRLDAENQMRSLFEHRLTGNLMWYPENALVDARNLTKKKVLAPRTGRGQIKAALHR